MKWFSKFFGAKSNQSKSKKVADRNYDIIPVIDEIIDGKKSVGQLSREEAMAIIKFYEEEVVIVNSQSIERLGCTPREGIFQMMHHILADLAHCGYPDVEKRYNEFVRELPTLDSMSRGPRKTFWVKAASTQNDSRDAASSKFKAENNVNSANQTVSNNELAHELIEIKKLTVSDAIKQLVERIEQMPEPPPNNKYAHNMHKAAYHFAKGLELVPKMEEEESKIFLIKLLKSLNELADKIGENDEKIKILRAMYDICMKRDAASSKFKAENNVNSANQTVSNNELAHELIEIKKLTVSDAIKQLVERIEQMPEPPPNNKYAHNMHKAAYHFAKGLELVPEMEEEESKNILIKLLKSLNELADKIGENDEKIKILRAMYDICMKKVKAGN